MFRHIGIVVEDIAKMSSFYKNGFNLEIIYHQIEGGEFIRNILQDPYSIEIIKMGRDGVVFLELLKFDKSKSGVGIDINERGITHFAVTISDVDDIVPILSNIGATFFGEPHINENGTHKVVFCIDPEGNKIELVQEL